MSICLRLIKEGRFHPSNPGGILEESYHEILDMKQPLIGKLSLFVYFLAVAIQQDTVK